MAKGTAYKVYEDAELTVAEVVVGKFKHEGAMLTSKRVCAFYPADTNKNKMANSGLKLVYQRNIREARALAEGIKKTTSGGEAVDLSDVPEV